MVKRLIFILLAFTFCDLHAQQMPVNDNEINAQYPFARAIFNRTQFDHSLDSVYKKLYRIKTAHSGKVSIVHIGDSHIQADMLSGTVREAMQDFFGNAGRGLIFPYQLAGSNTPDDIRSSSNTRWQFNRLAHPEINRDYGISGFGIRSSASGATINMILSDPDQDLSFNKLRFFLDSNSNNAWIFQANESDMPHVIKPGEHDTALYHEVKLDHLSNGFSLSALPSLTTRKFYGVSVENGKPGVLYHTIGVNGARYDQYNLAELFWEQLPALQADLYIVSLGTNEAQRLAFAEAAFERDLNNFIAKLKKSAPKAAILITTAPDSYRAKRFNNAVLQKLNDYLLRFCEKNEIAFWDLYRITGGYGSSVSWLRHGLLRPDRVHFSPAGYRLQGSMLYNALAKGYNSYIQTLQRTPQRGRP